MTDTEQNLSTNIKCATYCQLPREIIFIASAIGITIGLSWSLYLVLSWINQMMWYERYCSLPSWVSKLHSLTKVTVESPMLPQFYQKFIPPTKPKTRRQQIWRKTQEQKPNHKYTFHIVTKVRHVPRYTPIQQKQKWQKWKSVKKICVI